MTYFVGNLFKVGRVAVKSYASAALYPCEDCLHSFLLQAESTPGVIVRLEGLGRLRNAMTSLEIAKRT
jgi:hypothetical protein